MSDLVPLVVPALGRALLHFLWQGTAVGVVAAVLLRSQPGARSRHAVACVALLACVALAAMTFVLELGAHAPGVGAAAAAHALAGQPRLLGATSPAAGSWWPDIDTALPAIVALWAAGASALCLRTGIGVAWLRRLRATPQHAGLARWQARLDALARRFDLRGVALRIVPDLDSPVAAGWLRPIVLLPAAVVARMPVDLVEALLAHELAHIRRRDYLVNLMQALVEALLFYHPVVWWLSRRIRCERELLADAMAADAIGDPRRLARALAALSEHTPRHAPPRLAPAAHGGSLMPRIQLLVRTGRPPARAGRIALPALGIVVAGIAFYAQAQIGKPAASTPVATPAAATTGAHRSAHAAESSTARAAADAAATAHAAERAAAQARAEAQAAAGAKPRLARSGSARARDGFALVRSGEVGVTLSGSREDLRAIEAARRGMDRDFLWFRRGGKPYVVVDPGLVARAGEAWRDSDVLGAKMNALGREMEAHGKTMAGYGARMEQLAGTRTPTPAMRQAQERLQALAEEQQLLAGQQMKLARDMRKADDADREALEARSARLSERMEGLGAQMERQGKLIEAATAQLERNREPMEALGRQMEAAGKPMEALGARMEGLGRQQESLVREAERATQALISEALRKGLAAPAPSAR